MRAARNGGSDLQSILEIAQAHREGTAHGLSSTTTNIRKAKQIGDKLPAFCITSRNTKHVIKIRDRMPRDERAARCLLAPFQYRTALIDKSFAVERDV